MDEVKYIIAREQTLSISPADADKLLSRRDGVAALLYIYLLRHSGSFSLKEASERLGESPSRIRAAAEALGSMGLLEIRGIPSPAEELPEYDTADMKKRTAESAEFSALTAEVQSALGRVLSGMELKMLFGIYDYLALPPEVILMLVNFCISRTEKRFGEGKRPTMRTIEREAYAWANREITTLEMAEDHLKNLNRIESETEKIKSAVGIAGRELSSTERKYIESWAAMGFDTDCISLAYDKTVVKTGRLQWKYMDSIVKSWHSKGLHTLREIADGDVMSTGSAAKSNKNTGDPGISDLENMQRLMDKLRKD